MSLENAGPLTLVGAGKMGLALARGWLRAGLPPQTTTFVDPNPGELTRQVAGDAGVALVEAMPPAPPRVLVLAVKPQVLAAVLEGLRPFIGSETLVVSIAAGISLSALAQGCGSDRVIRVMPNTPAQVGAGISGAVAASGATADDRVLAEALLAAAGQVVWLEREGDIDALTAVSGSGPAYVFHLVEAMAAAGEAEGLSAEQAMVLARQTVIGAAALMAEDPTDAATLRRNVTSPKGTTEAALAVLMGPDGFGPLLARAVHAARVRSEELGQ